MHVAQLVLNIAFVWSVVNKLTKRYILQTFSIFFEEVTELRHGKPHPVIYQYKITQKLYMVCINKKPRV